MHRPDLVILDEPSTGLDPLIQQELQHLIIETRADGRTVFLSSHTLSEVELGLEGTAEPSVADREAQALLGAMRAVSA